jgi:PAS domain S-box-containing protein
MANAVRRCQMSADIDLGFVFSSLQVPVLIIDHHYRICEMNRAFFEAYGISREDALGRSCYEVTHRYPVPCSELGIECPVKIATKDLAPCKVIHRHSLPDGTVRWEEVAATPLREASGRVKYVIEELRDVSELLRTREIIDELKNEMKTLQGILPMCSHCHKIRDDRGEWHGVDRYIRSHTEAGISHGLCPECVKILYPGL